MPFCHLCYANIMAFAEGVKCPELRINMQFFDHMECATIQLRFHVLLSVNTHKYVIWSKPTIYKS